MIRFRMTPAIVHKLSEQIEAGITSEVQVVYVLAGIRKLIERDEAEDIYPVLRFHCDWALHSKMDRAAAKAILRRFDAAHPLLANGLDVSDLPAPLRHEIDNISQMRGFEDQLTQFLAAYNLPGLTLHRPDGWAQFLLHYARVIEDIPLVVAAPGGANAPVHISRVTVNCQVAERPADGTNELPFRVMWTIQDVNGHSGSIDIYHSLTI